jgi:hypothetical protein
MRKTYIDLRSQIAICPLETTNRKESCDWRRFTKTMWNSLKGLKNMTYLRRFYGPDSTVAKEPKTNKGLEVVN